MSCWQRRGGNSRFFLDFHVSRNTTNESDAKTVQTGAAGKITSYNICISLLLPRLDLPDDPSLKRRWQYDFMLIFEPQAQD
jgi:hypothetical protein